MKIMKTSEMIALTAAVLAIVALLAVGVFAQSAPFRFLGPLSRVLTPNGDGKNDMAIFCFDNPSDSDISGNIYSLLGSVVATMGPRMASSVSGPGAGCISTYGPGALGSSSQTMTWDGRSNGSAVAGGIYVYRITAELKSYTGTLIVVK